MQDVCEIATIAPPLIQQMFTIVDMACEGAGKIATHGKATIVVACRKRNLKASIIEAGNGGAVVMVIEKKVMGIDFGTSCTVISTSSVSSRFEPEIVEIDAKPFTETVMRLDENGEIELFGTEAWEQADQSPEQTYFEFKMGIGKEASVTGGKNRYTSKELGIIFLRRIREKIERQYYNGVSLSKQNMLCVVGFPAEWTEKQRLETLTIVQEAGFPNVQGCEEPVAVLYFHHFKGELSVDNDQTMIVYDFGGGTSDVAIVRTKANEKPKILGVGGATNLGGRNFDNSVYGFLLKQCDMDEVNLDPRDKVALRRAARNLKEKLSTAIMDGRSYVESTVTLHSKRMQKRLRLGIDDFNACCEPLIQRFNEPVWNALNRADIPPEAINVSVLAGGAARMHYVQKAIDALFPRDIILRSLNPGEVVAKGLALYGLSMTQALDSCRPDKPGEPLNEDSPAKVAPPVQEEPFSEPKLGIAAPLQNEPFSEPKRVEEKIGEDVKKEKMSDTSPQKKMSRGKLFLIGVAVFSLFFLVKFFIGGSEENTPSTQATEGNVQVTAEPAQPSLKPVTLDEIKQMSLSELESRANAGDVLSQYWLGEKYLKGIDVPQSYDKGFEWLFKAAEQGYATAQYWVGMYLQKGWGGVHHDESQAAEWFRKAAEKGDSKAQALLADLYFNGKGVSRSYEEAYKWYLKAAKQGVASSQNKVGTFLSEGWGGVPLDYIQAAEWYRKAAEQGNINAFRNLGYLYFYGKGVSKSYEEAYKWFLKAAQQGDRDSQYLVGRFLSKGAEGIQVNYPEAVEWYQKSAEQGKAKAQFFLAVAYDQGVGIGQNIKEAYRWYYIAHRLGNNDGEKRRMKMIKKKLYFFNGEISEEDAKNIEREADEYIRKKGWK